MCKIAGILCCVAIFTCSRSWQISWNSLSSIFAGQYTRSVSNHTGHRKNGPMSRGSVFFSLSAMKPGRLLQIICFVFCKVMHLSHGENGEHLEFMVAVLPAVSSSHLTSQQCWIEKKMTQDWEILDEVSKILPFYISVFFHMIGILFQARKLPIFAR